MKTHKTIRSLAAGGPLAFALLLAGMVPKTASAQQVDARWLPWLGCWEAADGGQDAPMLCVRPTTDPLAVELVTWADGQAISTESIQSDGVPREAEREDCQGIEEARFSQDGRRVYTKSEYTCEGGAGRAATGLMAMVNPAEWVDIRVVETGGQKVPWTLKYHLASSSRVGEAGMQDILGQRALAVREARIAASAPLTADDLIEASGRVDSEALVALIAERGDVFPVNSEMLLRLSDAGVSSKVIDVVVAVSYPDRFVLSPGAEPVEARPEYEPGRAYPPGYMGPWGGMGFWNPYFYDPFYYGYRGYGYGMYGGYYGGYYGLYRPTTIIVEPRASTGGRMVRGRGYVGSSSGSTRRAVPRSGTTGGSSGGSAARASGGMSRGGAGGSTGRVAKPRGGGGGGSH